MSNIDLLKRSSYFYDLPQEQIAQHPVTPRDASRLLVAGKDGTLADRHFYDLIDYLMPGDVLVINQSKVIPARIYAQDAVTGSPLEILLLRQKVLDRWRCMVRPGKKAKPGKVFKIAELATATVESIEDNGDRVIRFDYDHTRSFMELLDEIGQMPLPP